ncbi:MAG: hypothetical protein FK732_00175 [Asgard group archaeon]|nr:hypothetical protein [Asgard group archaeon]
MTEEYLQIEKLISNKLGKKKVKKSKEEQAILEILSYFQDGYSKKDPTFAEKWVKDLLYPLVQIVGTNSIYPGDFEWRTGHVAAIEMFENDWKHWGSLRIYLEHAEIAVENNNSWVTIFATVTRYTPEEENRTFTASRDRSLKRIKAIADSEMPSTLALYQIINDASSILFQYEQSELFVWPIRISMSLQKNIKWLIKQIHFSWPGRGFPVVRTLKED